MEETELTPWQWLRDTWHTQPHELLAPAGLGIALAQLMTAAFALRSSHHLLLLLCIAASAFALVRTVALFSRLSHERAEGFETRLSKRDLQELFLPPVGAVLLYALIAPGPRLMLLFAAVSLPQLLLFAYLARRYAAEFLPALPWRFPAVTLPALPRLYFPTFESIGMPVLQLGHALKVAAKSRRPVEKIPQIG